MAKSAGGAAANAGSDEDLEPVAIQMTVTVPGSKSAVLKFDDSISYDEFKKRLAAIGCDKVTYKNMAGKDVAISNDKHLDVFIDMMVDDFEGENKLKGVCVATGSSIEALSYMLACPAADNTSLIAFVEGLRWVESTERVAPSPACYEYRCYSAFREENTGTLHLFTTLAFVVQRSLLKRSSKQVPVLTVFL
jgi:hypothetical protein